MNILTMFPKNNSMLISGVGKEIIKKQVEETCKELGYQFVVTVVKNSYYICILVGISGFILYMFGWKKVRNAPIIAFGVYLIIRVVGGVLCGV